MVVSAGYVGGTRGSGIVSSTADVLWMSVVRGMRGVGEVCAMCMCLAWGGVGGFDIICTSCFSMSINKSKGQTFKVIRVFHTWSVLRRTWCASWDFRILFVTNNQTLNVVY